MVDGDTVRGTFARTGGAGVCPLSALTHQDRDRAELTTPLH
jgi:hypothetical protein